MSTRDAALARFLRSGPDQERLLEQMAHGHARLAHGEELGRPSAGEFKDRVHAHLQRAPYIYATESSAGIRAYLVADPGTNQVAWIPPHKPHRATFFQPQGGVTAFVARKQALYGLDRWRAVDPARLRAAPARTPPHRIVTTDRGTRRAPATRVP